MWLLTGRQLNTFIGQAEQEIPNKIEGIPLQALFLEKLKKTLHRFKHCKKSDFKQNNLLLGLLHMSLVNCGGSVSAISPHHSFLHKNFDVG